MKIFLLIWLAVIVSLFTLYPQSLRLDEAQSIWVATKSVRELVKLTAADVHTPLYFLILHFWLKIFGTGVMAARTLSLLFLLISLYFLYKMVLEVANQKMALITICLFAFSPFIVWYSTETRMYTFFVLLSIVNHLFFVRLIKTNGSAGKFGLFSSTLLGLYTHYFFTFLSLTQFIYLLINSVILGKFKLFLKFLLTLSTAASLFLPWILYAAKSGLGAYTQPQILLPSSYNLFQTFILFFFGFQPQNIQSILVSFWPLLVMVIFFIFTSKLEFPPFAARYFLMATFLPVALTYAVSFIFKPLFLSRYLIFITPFLFLITSWMLINVAKKHTLLVTLLLITVMLAFLIYQNNSAYSPIRENYASVAKYLNQHTTPQDIVAISAPFTVYPIEYYYLGAASVSTIPEWDRFSQGAIPQYSRENLDKRIKKYQGHYLRIFVVLSYDQGYEQDIRDYFNQNYLRLNYQRFSPGLEISVYRLRYDILL